MEDVLDVYHRPRDPECPVVCLDETSKQLVPKRVCRCQRSQAVRRGMITSMASNSLPPQNAARD
jgi:hypothetical protein